MVVLQFTMLPPHQFLLTSPTSRSDKKVAQRQGKIILTVELLPSDRCVLALGKFVLRVEMSDEPSDSPCTWKRKHAVAAQLAAARAKRTCEGGGLSTAGGDEDDSSDISLEAAQEYADDWVLTYH